MQVVLPWLKGYHRSGESQGLDLITEFVLTNRGKTDKLPLLWNERVYLSSGDSRHEVGFRWKAPQFRDETAELRDLRNFLPIPNHPFIPKKA
jgi:hypothetical protein